MANTPTIASPSEPSHGPAPWREHRAIAGSVVGGPAFVARMSRADFLCRLIYNAASDARVPFAEGLAYR
jgi:hypothetical protein